MTKEPKHADVDLTEPIPEELGGAQENTDRGYVPATRQSTALAAPGETALDLTGMRPPFLQQVYGPGIGKLSEDFPAQSLVLDGRYEVFAKAKKGEPDVKLQAIFLKISQYVKDWQDKAAFDAGILPATYRDMAEAAAAGKIVAWGPRGSDIKPNVSRAMDIVMLIKKPAKLECGLFGINIGDDGEWAICMLSVDKGSYPILLKDIGAICNGKLKQTGLFSGLWEIYTDLSQPKPGSTNRFQNIRADFKGVLDPKIVAGIRAAMAVPVNDADDDVGDE